MAGDFGSTRAARAFKWLTILGCAGTLAFLVAEMRRENFAGEWRAAQARYAERLAPELAAGYEIGLKQAFVPALAGAGSSSSPGSRARRMSGATAALLPR